jgi:F0F1-type ATP synthase membrane subunit b/b'
MSSEFLQIFLLVNVFIIGSLTAVAIQHAYAHFKPHPQDADKSHQPKHDTQLPAEVRERLLQTSQANFQAVLDRSAADLERYLKVTTERLNRQMEKLGAGIVGDEAQLYHTDFDELRNQAKNIISGAQTEFAETIKSEAQRYRAGLDELRRQAETTIGGAQTEIAKTISGESQRYHTYFDELRNQAKTVVDGAQTEFAETIHSETQRYHASLNTLRNQAETTIGGAQTEIAKHQTELETKLAELKAELEPKLVKEIAAEKLHLIQQIDTKLADAVASFLVETLQHNVDLGAQSAYLTAMLDEHKAELVKEITDEA